MTKMITIDLETLLQLKRLQEINAGYGTCKDGQPIARELAEEFVPLLTELKTAALLRIVIYDNEARYIRPEYLAIVANVHIVSDEGVILMEGEVSMGIERDEAKDPQTYLDN